jgi:hypothetical protein
MEAGGRSRRGERTAAAAGCFLEEYVEVEEYVQVYRSISTGRMSKVRASDREAAGVAVAGTEAAVEDEQPPPKRLSWTRKQKRTRLSCRALNSSSPLSPPAARQPARQYKSLHLHSLFLSQRVSPPPPPCPAPPPFLQTGESGRQRRARLCMWARTRAALVEAARRRGVCGLVAILEQVAILEHPEPRLAEVGLRHSVSICTLVLVKQVLEYLEGRGPPFIASVFVLWY